MELEEVEEAEQQPEEVVEAVAAGAPVAVVEWMVPRHKGPQWLRLPDPRSPD